MAALVHQVHNHFQFVQALEIGDFLGITGLYQGLKCRVNQGGHAAAENALFAEQVALRFVFYGGFQHAGAGTAHAFSVGQTDLLGVSGGVLVDCQQAGNTDALGEQFAHAMTGRLRGHHHYVHVIRRNDFLIVDAKAVGDHQGIARL